MEREAEQRAMRRRIARDHEARRRGLPYDLLYGPLPNASPTDRPEPVVSRVTNRRTDKWDRFKIFRTDMWDHFKGHRHL